MCRARVELMRWVSTSLKQMRRKKRKKREMVVDKDGVGGDEKGWRRERVETRKGGKSTLACPVGSREGQSEKAGDEKLVEQPAASSQVSQ